MEPAALGSERPHPPPGVHFLGRVAPEEYRALLAANLPRLRNLELMFGPNPNTDGGTSLGINAADFAPLAEGKLFPKLIGPDDE